MIHQLAYTRMSRPEGGTAIQSWQPGLVVHCPTRPKNGHDMMGTFLETFWSSVVGSGDYIRNRGAPPAAVSLAVDDAQRASRRCPGGGPGPSVCRLRLRIPFSPASFLSAPRRPAPSAPCPGFLDPQKKRKKQKKKNQWKAP
ncbi:hypothetical protein CSOJ01_02493 [Colletotrichum sojae]|uniref:Uncharacterized protein n=1 Tax=Colletotrichum sojae TaxID=2175907 RepID=A0A8H6JR28_9PEZI|nr:hypothetical protein CSOJ01_02493 [Colletotrichum sojae]